MALFFLAFVVGEGPPPIFRLSLQQNLQFAGLCGLVVGLLLAWKWEGWGGLIALASFVLLLALNRKFNTGWLFLAPAAAAVLHLACWWRLKAGPPAAGTAWAVPKTAMWTVAGVVGVFILLCANEMFGQPPLMTRALRPSAEMVGDWTGAADIFLLETSAPRHVEVAWRIAPDGGVSGQVGGRAVEGGRMRNDRSWFGRLMHWRQPYAIDGQGFCAGIILRTGEMDGTLTVGGAPYRLTLRKQ